MWLKYTLALVVVVAVSAQKVNIVQPNPITIGQSMEVSCSVASIGGINALPGLHSNETIEKIKLLQNIGGKSVQIVEYTLEAVYFGKLPKDVKDTDITNGQTNEPDGNAARMHITMKVKRALWEHVTPFLCEFNYTNITGQPITKVFTDNVTFTIPINVKSKLSAGVQLGEPFTFHCSLPDQQNINFASLQLVAPELQIKRKDAFSEQLILKQFLKSSSLTAENDVLFESGLFDRQLLSFQNQSQNFELIKSRAECLDGDFQYICVFSVDYGGRFHKVVSHSSTVDLKVEPGRPTLTQASTTVEIGSDASVTCEAIVGRQGEGKGRIRWRIHGPNLKADQFKVDTKVAQKNPNCAEIQISTLTLLNVNKKHQSTTVSCFVVRDDNSQTLPNACTNKKDQLCQTSEALNVVSIQINTPAVPDSEEPSTTTEAIIWIVMGCLLTLLILCGTIAYGYERKDMAVIDDQRGEADSENKKDKDDSDDKNDKEDDIEKTDQQTSPQPEPPASVILPPSTLQWRTGVRHSLPTGISTKSVPAPKSNVSSKSSHGKSSMLSWLTGWSKSKKKVEISDKESESETESETETETVTSVTLPYGFDPY